MHALKPRLAIIIGERMPLAHLFDIRRRMKVISVGELPTQFVRQATTDCRFPRSGYAHDQNDHNAPILKICRADDRLPSTSILKEETCPSYR